MNELLKLLENDARLSPETLALMLDKETGDIKKMIEEYEREGVIVGYHTMIDWDKTDREYVTAMIELKITPQRDRGYDHIAQKIYNYPEVETLYLMSGGFDLAVSNPPYFPAGSGAESPDPARAAARSSDVANHLT